MKTPAILSLGLLALVSAPLQATQHLSEGMMPYLYPNSVSANETSAPALPSSVVNSAPSAPLVAGLTTNTTMQLWDVSSQTASVNPITNGPAIAPVPDAGSSILFLALGLFGMLTLRRLTITN